jgi:hypothetical protein
MMRKRAPQLIGSGRLFLDVYREIWKDVLERSRVPSSDFLTSHLSQAVPLLGRGCLEPCLPSLVVRQVSQDTGGQSVLGIVRQFLDLFQGALQ